MRKSKITIVVVGRSGSGKGTQAKFILGRLGKRQSWHLETGRFIRALLEKKHSNLTIDIVRERLANGKMAPTWFAAFIVLRELIAKGHAGKHLVADGYPRDVWQAKLLDDVLAVHGRAPALCIYIDVSAREATRRLLARGRKDDTPSLIKNRMAYFRKSVLPVIWHYKKFGRLIRIDGSRSAIEVSQELDRALQSVLGSRWLRS